MIDKKTLVLVIGISWALTLVTVLLISNFAPSLTQSFTQQVTESNSVKVVTLKKQEVMNMQDMGGIYFLNLNFSWSPSNPKNNAIFGIILSLECKNETLVQNELNVQYHININEFQDESGSMRIYNPNGDWEFMSFEVTSITNRHEWINPNQSEYPIKLSIFVVGNQMSIRNVNLMLLVVDG